MLKRHKCKIITVSQKSAIDSTPFNVPCHPLILLEITSSNKTDCLPLMQKIFDTVGQPRNYGPSSQDGQEEKMGEAEERMRREAQENVEEKRRATRWEEWVGAKGGAESEYGNDQSTRGGFLLNICFVYKLFMFRKKKTCQIAGILIVM